MFCVPVISVPSVVMEFLSSFSTYLHRPELSHLARYLTGLLTLVNKTAWGISSLIFGSPHPSNLSRFFSRGKWNSEDINAIRLEKEKQRLSGANPKFGTLIIDDFLVEKSGKKIYLTGRHYDHSSGRYIWGHQYVSSLLVHRRGTVAVDLKPYVRREDCERYQWEFKSKNELFRESVRGARRAELPFDCVVFDSWYLNRDNCDYVERSGLNWVSHLKRNTKIRWRGKKFKVSRWYKFYGGEFKEKEIETKPYKDEVRRHRVIEVVVYVYFLGRKGKLLVERGERGEERYYLTNHLEWDARQVLTRYRYRWVVETYHRDLKQHLGLGECEMRTKEAVLHHVSAVLMGATLLERMVSESGLVEWAERQRSTGMGRKQRHLLAFVVRDFILWILRYVGTEESKAEEVFKALHEHLRLEELERVMRKTGQKGGEDNDFKERG